MRSYGARRGRLSPLTRERLAQLGPSRSVPPGPLDAVAAFGRRAPLVLEVGCGHGAAAIGYAAAHPGDDVLALDVYQPGIARMLAHAEAAGVRNLRAEIGDAVAFLDERVAPGQLAAVHLFFPDPWPKAKHAKRRFVGPGTLDLLASRLAASGHVLVATDQPAYAAYVMTQVRAHGAFTASETQRPPWRPVDGFEAKALTAGRSITDLRLERASVN